MEQYPHFMIDRLISDQIHKPNVTKALWNYMGSNVCQTMPLLTEKKTVALISTLAVLEFIRLLLSLTTFVSLEQTSADCDKDQRDLLLAFASIHLPVDFTYI